MNLTFHSAHLDTLNKLNELAKKHNSFIKFGTYNSHSNSNDYVETIFDYFGYKYRELLQNDEVFYEVFGDFIYDNNSEVWFELIEKDGDKNKYHIMSYKKNNLCMELQYDWKEKLEERIDGIDQEKVKQEIKDFIQFVENENYEYGYTLDMNNKYTEIRGFGNKEKIVDNRVYRQDMALHFFMELVCDYFKEEHINNTY